jgi:hypothetical protein
MVSMSNSELVDLLIEKVNELYDNAKVDDFGLTDPAVVSASADGAKDYLIQMLDVLVALKEGN